MQEVQYTFSFSDAQAMGCEAPSILPATENLLLSTLLNYQICMGCIIYEECLY